MKKTKAQLEKELAKTQKKLEFYEKACVKQPEPTDVKCDPALTNVPEFALLIDRLSGELRTQRELCDQALQKLAYIDGLPLEENADKSKVYKNGVVGSLDQLNDVAQANRNSMLTIASRLTELVG